MVISVDEVVYPLAEALRVCLEAELGRVASPPAVVCLRPGQQVELLISTTRDECCEGLAWVRVASIFPSSAFPAPDSTVSKCGPLGWAAVLEMGVARCAPMGDERTIPSCGEWAAATRAVLDDAAAMRRALACCFASGPNGVARRYLPGVWAPNNTEGGCVGGTMAVTVAAGIDCCEEESA